MASAIYNFKRANYIQFNKSSSDSYYEFYNPYMLLGKSTDSYIYVFYKFSIDFAIVSMTDNVIIPIFGTSLGISCWYKNGNIYIVKNISDPTKITENPIISDVPSYSKIRISFTGDTTSKVDYGYTSYFINISISDIDNGSEYSAQTEFVKKIDLSDCTVPNNTLTTENCFIYIGGVNGVNQKSNCLQIFGYETTDYDGYTCYNIPGRFSSESSSFLGFADTDYIKVGSDGSCSAIGTELSVMDNVNRNGVSKSGFSKAIVDYSLDLESATSLTINEGSVAKLQDKDGNILWEAAKHKYKNAYGIRWKNSDVTKVERVGNMNLHKTLPIQTKFKTCCYNHISGDILYADPNDRRFVIGNDDYSFGVPKAYKVIPNTEYTSTKYYTPFGKPQYIVPLYSGFDGEEGIYLYNYIRVIDKDGHKVVFYVQGVDAENKYLICYYIEGDKTNTNIFNTSSVSTQAGEVPIASLTVELGFPINGYYGSVMVDTGGSFYLWSEEAATDNDYNYVWISEEKPDGVDAQYNPRTLVSADTVAIKSGEIKASDKNGNVSNDSWGYLGQLDDGAAICCRNFSPELRGGDGSTNEDLMLQPIESGKQPMDYFIALTRQGKPKGAIQKTACDAAHELNDMTGMTYATYKGIFWLEAIEYASFRYTQDFKDPKNGLKQGGLGKNVINNVVEKTGKDWLSFNNRVPLNTCLSSFDIGEYDCKTAQGTYHLYRNDGICYTKTDKYTFPTSYRGIEWRFGDRRTFLSDITTSTHITYTYYSEPKKQLTETVNCYLNGIGNGYYSTFMLGNKADIFPKASSIGVTEEKCIGSHNVNTTEGYFVVGFILEPLSTFYRGIAGSDIFVNPNLGTVQQIVIG